MTTQNIEYTSDQLKAMSDEMYKIMEADENFDANFRRNEKATAAQQAFFALNSAIKDLRVFETGKVNSFRPAVLQKVTFAVAKYNNFKSTL